MKKIRMFIIDGDSDCDYAKQIVQRLCTENRKYSGLQVEFIDEARNESLADGYGYFFVPALFTEETFTGKDGREVVCKLKLHEGTPSEIKLKQALDKAVSREPNNH